MYVANFDGSRVMAHVDSDDSCFGDDMVLVAIMKAHTRSQGLGVAAAVVAAAPIKKAAQKHNVRTAAVLALCM